MASWAFTSFPFHNRPTKAQYIACYPFLILFLTFYLLFLTIFVPNNAKKLEGALISGIYAQYRAWRYFNGSFIISKLRQMQPRINSLLPQERYLNIMFRNGSMFYFQRLCNLKYVNSHGESGDADYQAISIHLPLFQSIIRKFSLNDLFNADGFSLFHFMSPDNTISRKDLRGMKKSEWKIKQPLFLQRRWKLPYPPDGDWKWFSAALFWKTYRGWIYLWLPLQEKSWVTSTIFWLAAKVLHCN